MAGRSGIACHDLQKSKLTHVLLRDGQLETLQGKAKHVRSSLKFSGGSDNSKPSTTHITLFVLNQDQVKAESSEPILVNEGDSVLVGGAFKNGVFNALAYSNLTTRVKGNKGWMSELMYGMAALAASYFVFVKFPSSYFGNVSNLAIGVLILLGGLFFYQGYRIRQAMRAVREAAIGPGYPGAQ
jgi:hypothetical protein